MGWFITNVAYAAENAEVARLVGKINDVVLNPIIGFFFALALILFLWGIVEFFWNRESEVARDKGKKHILWGIVGMFIMFAVFAIMRIIVNTLGVTNVDIP